MSKNYTHKNFQSPPEDMIDAYYDGLSKVWLPVAPVGELQEGTAKSITILGREIMLAKLDEQIVAMPNFCPHFQAKLSEGTVERLCGTFERVVRCQYHGWAFNAKGECVEIPQLEDGQKIPKAANLDTYKTKIGHDLIWVCLDGEPENDLPVFPECDGADMALTPMQYSEPWNGSMVRMMLSVLDDYHFPWLHEGVLGTRDKPMPPKRQITWDGNTLTSAFQAFQPSNVTNAVDGNRDGSNVDYQMIVDMPNIIRLVKKNEDGGLYVVQFFPVPLSFDKTALFWRVARNYDVGLEGDKKIVDMEKFIQSQDRGHVGMQKPWLMPPTPIKSADDALVSYLSGLKKYGISPRI